MFSLCIGTTYADTNITNADITAQSDHYTTSDNNSYYVIEAILEHTTSGSGVIYHPRSGTLYVNKNSHFSSNKANYGGAIYINSSSSTATITDANFTGNHSSQNGGAIYNKGTLNINAVTQNVLFSNNYTEGNYGGGAIWNTRNLNLNATGGNIEFTGNYKNSNSTDSNSVYLSGGDAVMDINTSSGYSVIFNDKVYGASDKCKINKSGEGTLVLNNNMSGFTKGNVNINEGIVKIGSNGTFFSSTTGLNTFADGTTFDTQNGQIDTGLSLGKVKLDGDVTLKFDVNTVLGTTDTFVATSYSGTGNLIIDAINMLNIGTGTDTSFTSTILDSNLRGHVIFNAGTSIIGSTSTWSMGYDPLTGVLTLNVGSSVNDIKTAVNSDELTAYHMGDSETLTDNIGAMGNKASMIIDSTVSGTQRTVDGDSTYGGMTVGTYSGNRQEMTITDIKFQNFTTTGNGGVINNSGKFSLTNVDFDNNEASEYGGAIYANGNSRISKITGNFSNNAAGKYGGAIFNYGNIGDLEHPDTAAISGDFTNNTTTSNDGGAIYTNGGTITKIVSNFGASDDNTKGNTAANGGAIYNYSTIYSINSNFYNNTATTGSGGAIYNTGTIGDADHPEAVAISGTFKGNTAENANGGAIYNKGTITTISATFGGTGSGEGNTSKYGGAIYNTSTGTITKIDSNFYNNSGTSSAGGGGAIYNEGTIGDTEHPETTAISGTFKGNAAANYSGGAIYNKGTITTISATFGGTGSGEGNTSKYGGAIYNDTGKSITSISANFYNNTATSGYGGAIYNLGTISAISGTFKGNTATSSGCVGGAIYNNGTITTLTGTFGGTGSGEGNSAKLGGAIFNETGKTIDSITANFYNNTALYANSGGAIYNRGTITIKTNNTDDIVFQGNKSNGISNAIHSEGGTVNFDGTKNIVMNDRITSNSTATFNKDGDGTLVLAEDMSGVTGTVNVNAGTVKLAQNSLDGEVYGTGFSNATTVYANDTTIDSRDGKIDTFNLGNSVTLNGTVYALLDADLSAQTADQITAGGEINGSGGIVVDTIQIIVDTSVSNAPRLLTIADEYTKGKISLKASGVTVTGASDNWALSYSTSTGKITFTEGATLPKAIQLNENDKIYEMSKNEIVHTNLGTMGGNAMIIRSDTAGTQRTVDGDSTYGGMTVGTYTDGESVVHPQEMTITDVKFQNFTTSDGWGTVIKNNGGILELNNVTFENNSTTNGSGGAIYNWGTITSITGNFGNASDNTKGNSAYGNGGAIYNDAEKTITSISANFYNNTSTNGWGGAISNSGTIDNVSGNFENNSAIIGNGGTIYNWGTITNITGNFGNATDNTKGNIANGDGGAIYNDSNKTINNISANFYNNSSTNGSGGAIFNTGEINTIGSSTNFISGNSAKYYGGAVYNTSTATITTLASALQSNSSVEGGGGAVYNAGTITTIGSTGVTHSNNTSLYAGGAIHNEGTINNIIGNFSSNKSINGSGGAIYNETNSTTTTIITGNFTNNLSKWGGGAIYNKKGNLTIQTNGADLTFSGNRAGAFNDSGVEITGESNAIYNENGTVTFNTQNTDSIILNDKLQGSENGKYVKSGTGTLVLAEDMSGVTGTVNVNAGTVKLNNNSTFFSNASKTTFADGTTLDAQNGQIETVNLGKTVEFTGNVNAKIDVDLTGSATDTTKSDKFTADSAVTLTGDDTVGLVINTITLGVLDNISETSTVTPPIDGTYIQRQIADTNVAGAVQVATGVRVNLTNGGDYKWILTYNNSTGILSFNNGWTLKEAVNSTETSVIYNGVINETLTDDLGELGGTTTDIRMNGYYIDGANSHKGITTKSTSQNLYISDTEVKNFTGTDHGGFINDQKGITITLKNSTFNNNFTTDSNKSGGAIYKKGNLTATNISFTNNTATGNGGAIYSYGKNVNIDATTAGINLNNNTATLGGAIYENGSNSGTININTNGGDNVITFNSNTATGDYGGAIYKKGILNAINVNFNNNTATRSGGAIYTDGRATNIDATLEDTTFYNNSAKSGGAIFNNGANSGTVSINANGGTEIIKFDSNSATDGSGGAIYSTKNLSVNKALFTSNTATEKGGALYISGTGNNIENSTFKSNSATNYGGAVYNTGTITTLSGTFGGTTAGDGNIAKSGGAIYNDGTITTLSGTFIANEALAGNGLGGALFNSGTITNAIDGTFISNKAYRGGAIYQNSNNAISTASTSVFKGNTALSGDGYGGAIYNAGTITTLSGTFGGTTAGDGNSAKLGGAIYNASTITTLSGTFIANEALAGNGGAIYNNTGKLITSISANFYNNSSTDGWGGAISNSGTIGDTTDLTKVAISGDFEGNSTPNGSGGAIYNWGTITNITGNFGNASDNTKGNSANGNGGAILNDSGKTINSISANFYNNSSTNGWGGAISNSGTIDNVSGNFENNSAIIGNGGAIYNWGTITNITGNFGNTSDNTKGNSANSNGGAILNDSGKTINSILANFYNNTSTNGWGGAISNSGTIGDTTDLTKTAISGNFEGNSTPNGSGGAIYNWGTITNISSNFSNNSAGSNGGAIYNEGSITSINGNFINNLATTNGSGAAIYNTSTINSIGSSTNLISGNSSKYYGGAVYNSSSATITTLASALQSNSSVEGGGGAVYNAGTITTIGSTGVVHSNNTSFYGGGAIHNEGTISTILGDFTANKSTGGSGGAIYNKTNTTTPTIITGNFTNNLSKWGGGAIYNEKGNLTVQTNGSDLTFSGNRAGAFNDLGVEITGESNAIYNENGTVTFNTQNTDNIILNDRLQGTTNGKYVKNGDGTLVLAEDMSGVYGEVNINAGTVKLAQNSLDDTIHGTFFSNASKTTFAGGTTLDAQNGYTETINLGEVEFTGNVNAKIDVDLTGSATDTTKSDKFAATSPVTLTGEGTVGLVLNTITLNVLENISETSTVTPPIDGTYIQRQIADTNVAGAVQVATGVRVNLTNGGDYKWILTYNNSTGILSFNNGWTLKEAVNSTETSVIYNALFDEVVEANIGSLGGTTTDIRMNGYTINGYNSVSNKKYSGIFIEGTSEQTLSISNTEFKNFKNTGTGNGSAIIFKSDARNKTVNLTDTDFKDNTSSNNGGAIGVTATNSVVVNVTAENKDVTFSNNEASGNIGGGAIENNSSVFNIAGTNDHKVIFNGNKALKTTETTKASGGAIDMRGSAKTNLTNAEFTNNTAIGNGGAIGVNGSSSKLTVTDTNFTNNTATEGLGGAIYNVGTTTINAENSDVTFSGNTDSTGSNAIYNAGTLNLNASEGKAIIFQDKIASSDTDKSLIKDGTGTLLIDGADMSGYTGKINFKSGTIKLDNGGKFFSSASEIAISGAGNTLDTLNGAIEQIDLGNLKLTNDLNIAIDVDLSTGEIDNYISTGTITGSKSIIIDTVATSMKAINDKAASEYPKASTSGDSYEYESRFVITQIANADIAGKFKLANHVSLDVREVIDGSTNNHPLTGWFMYYNNTTGELRFIDQSLRATLKDTADDTKKYIMTGDETIESDLGAILGTNGDTSTNTSVQIAGNNTYKINGNNRKGITVEDGQKLIVENVLEISGFKKNSENGGFINIKAGGEASVTDSTVKNNTVNNSNGGAIYLTSSNLTLDGTNFDSNSATRTGSSGGSGGAIYNYAGTISEAVGASASSFTNNSADNNGGAIGNLGKSTTQKAVIQSLNATFTGNTATASGGAIYNRLGDINSLTGTFTSNTADNGGAIYNQSGTIGLNNVIFDDNGATTNGGAIYNGSGNSVINMNNVDVKAPTGVNKNDIYNAGTINVTAGTNKFESDITNTNSLNVQDGTNTFSGTITNTGNITFGGNNTISGAINTTATGENKIDFTGVNELTSTASMTGDMALTNSGNLTLNSDLSAYTGAFTQTGGSTNVKSTATLFGGNNTVQDGIMTIAGTVKSSLEITGGTVSSSGTFANGSTTTVNGGTLNIYDTSKAENGSSIALNSGTINFTGGTLKSGSTTTINGGTFNMSGTSKSESAITLNSGTANFTGGSLENGSTTTVNGGTFNMSGTSAAKNGSSININSGTMNFTGGSLESGSTTNVNGGILNLNGGTSDSGSNIKLNSGTLNYQTGGINGDIQAVAGNLNILENITFKGNSYVKDDTVLNIAENKTLTVQDLDPSNTTGVHISSNDTWNGNVNVGAGGILSVKDITHGNLNQTGGVSNFDNTVLNMQNVNISGGDVNLKSTTLNYAPETVFTPVNMSFAGGSNINMMNNVAGETFELNNITSDGTNNIYIDINPNAGLYDSIHIKGDATGVNSGELYVSAFNYIGGTPKAKSFNLQLFSVDGDINNINFGASEQALTSALGVYKLISQGGGAYKFSMVSYNPQIYRGQVATLAAYNNQLNVNNIVLDQFILQNNILPNSKTANKYASAQNLLAPYQHSLDEGGVWFKSYVDMETLTFSHNLSAHNTAYGSLVGADLPLKHLKHGWDFVPTLYLGYNGATQSFKNVSMYQNGGQLGFMGTFFHKDFIGSIMAYGGGYNNEMNVNGKRDETGNWFAGTAAKLAYNLHPTKHFIIQPTAFISYNIFGKQNWHSDFGSVGMNSGLLNGINVAPGLNFIYKRETWSVYATFQYMYNINEQISGRAANIDVPNLKMRHGYFTYGIGVTKTWKDRFSSYLQIAVRNGGRTGIGFQLGLRYAFDWRLKSKDHQTPSEELPEMKPMLNDFIYK